VTETYPDTQDAAAEPPAAAPRADRRPRVVRAALGLAAALLVVACALLAAAGRSARSAAADREAVLAAARQEAVNLTSQDYRTVDGDLRRMGDGATGQLRADLEQRSAQAKQVVVKNKAVARGAAAEAGLVALGRDQATVVVAVDSTVSSAGVRTPVARRYRFQLDLSLVGGRWLVANLTAVGLTG